MFTLRRPTSLKQSSFGHLRMFFSQGIYDLGKNKKKPYQLFHRTKYKLSFGNFWNLINWLCDLMTMVRETRENLVIFNNNKLTTIVLNFGFLYSWSKTITLSFHIISSLLQQHKIVIFLANLQMKMHNCIVVVLASHFLLTFQIIAQPLKPLHQLANSPHISIIL